jgi:hypothetical protein
MKLPVDTRPRLIVSFAIENAAKVRAQKLRNEKTSSKSRAPKDDENAKRSGEHIEDEREMEASLVQKGRKRSKSDASESSKSSEPKPYKKQKQLENKPSKMERKPTKSKVNGENISPPKRKRSQKPKRDEDISNRKFEKLVRKRPLASDNLDEIVSKRSSLFDVPEQPKKRWFEE